MMNAETPFAKPLKLVAVGNSTGVVLPKEVLASFGLQKGDEVFPVSTPDGVELRKFDPRLSKQLDAVRAVMRKRRSALHELAK
ncbi:MAG: AbrB/MazE/SpoVT family DNA-binding domain-containing protein [Pacificimonas sp.]